MSSEPVSKAHIHAVAGMVAGMSATVTTFPLDLVKTKFQVHDGSPTCKYPRYRSTWDALKQTGRAHGIRGLYSGLSPNLVGSGAAWGLYFLSYTRLKELIRVSRDLEEGTPLEAPWHLAAATASGVGTCLITNPIWLIKTRMQLQYDAPVGGARYAGMVDALVTIVRDEGVRGLYKGLVPSLLGVTHGAAQFMAYEELKKWLLYSWLHESKYEFVPRPLLSDVSSRAANRDEAATATAAAETSTDSVAAASAAEAVPHASRKLSTYEAFVLGALSKMFASVVSYPYQVLRARLQIQTEVRVSERKYRSAWHALRSILTFEGVRGLYKGLVPTMLRVTPGACVTFAVYERVSQALLHTTSDADT